MTRVLVVEDNLDLGYGLRNNFEIEGYGVELVTDGSSGLERALSGEFDLLVLDLMLTDLDGFRVLRGVRARDRGLPILVLTARGEEADKVRAFKLGADDYVTKPFGLLELLARAEALLRRAGGGSEHDGGPIRRRFGGLFVDEAARTVTREGTEIGLTPKELDLLLALIRRRGVIATRVELLEEVWGYSSAVVSRTVDTHVSELRRKLEENVLRPALILTVRKSGYRWGG